MQGVSQSAWLEEAGHTDAAVGSAAVASEVPIDGGAADPKGLGNRGHGVLPGSVHLLGHLQLVAGHDRGSAAVAATGPSRGQPSRRAFADEVAFELGQGRKDATWPASD